MAEIRIDREEIERLAELARIELSPDEKAPLARDLAAILGHIEELNGLDTAGVEPMSGGVETVNILRDDAADRTLVGKGKDAFPMAEGDYLKVPPVFD